MTQTKIDGADRPPSLVEARGSLISYRRKIYLAALGLGAAASLMNLYIKSSEHNPDLYERIILPLLFSVCASLLLILWRYSNSQPFVEAGMCLLASASLLSRLYFGLYLNANPLGLTVELSVLAAWIPIIYILNFLLLNGKPAVWASVFSYAVMLAISLPHLLTNRQTETGAGEAFILIQYYFSHAIYILLLLVLTSLRERYALSRALTQTLSDMALTDALTGLPNRRQIESALEQEMSRAQRESSPLAVIMLDLDRFKQINDTFGHQAGDQVLREIGSRLRLSLRGADHLARWGGEEFLIVAPDTDHTQAGLLAEKLRRLIENKPIAGAGTVTGSFGGTSYRTGETAGDFVKRADEALYRAKQEGRDQVRIV